MIHPLNIVPVNYRARLFASLFILTLAVMAALNILGEPLITEAAPAGIISYEFAANEKTAQSILDSWDDRAKIFAGFNLGLDYLFLILYASTIALAIILLADKNLGRAVLFLATALAWGQWLAAGLDAVENAPCQP